MPTKESVITFYTRVVVEYLSQHQHISVKELVNHVVTKFPDVTEKSLRRRIYDVLHTLDAVGLLSYEKKEIFWLGYPVVEVPVYYPQPDICAGNDFYF